MQKGTELPEIKIAKISEDMIRAYASLSDDENVIHFDKEEARKAGFPDRIAHGMLTMALCSRLCSPWLTKQYFVAEFNTTFRYPLFLGDSLHITGRVLEENDQYVYVTFSGENGTGKIVVLGEVKLKRR